MKRLLQAAPLLLLALYFLAAAGPGRAETDDSTALWLPWEGGSLWTYLQGPHSNLNGLDFQPPDASGKPCEVFHSAFYITAAAPGKVYVKPNTIEIDHGDGFSTGYMHIENRLVKTGDTVNAGDRLGTPGCCPDGWGLYGCWSTAPHLHFYTVRDGFSPGIAGLNLGGWRVRDDGCLGRIGQVSCPLSGRIVSNSPRQGQNSPSTPADIALVVDTSRMSGTEDRRATTSELGMALLQASRPDDKISVIEFNAQTHKRAELREAVTDGAIDKGLVTAINTSEAGGRTNLRLGLVNACAELLSKGEAPAHAVILVSDGQHNVGAFSAVEECFSEAGIPVYAYGVGRANTYLLRRLATRTGGEFHQLSEIDNFYCEFLRVRTLMSGDPPGLCTTFQLKRGERLSLPFKIPEDQDQATMEIRWRDRRTSDQVKAEGIPVRAQILNPRGAALKKDTQGIRYIEDDGSIRYLVSYPTAGEWKLIVTATDKVPKEGLFITFTASTIPQAPPYLQLEEPPESLAEGEGPTFFDPEYVCESPEDPAQPTPMGSGAPVESPVESPASDTPAPTEEPTTTEEPLPTEEPTTTDEPAPTNGASGPTPSPLVVPVVIPVDCSSPTAAPRATPTPAALPTDTPTATPDGETPAPTDTPPPDTPPPETPTPPPDTPPPETPTPDPP